MVQFVSILVHSVFRGRYVVFIGEISRKGGDILESGIKGNMANRIGRA
jgi:hypothetical protein